MRKALIVTLFSLCANIVCAQEKHSLIIGGDTLSYRYIPIDQSNTSSADGGSGRSFLEPIPVGRDGYISFMVAPLYSVETNFGLGAAVSYSRYRADEGVVKVDDLHKMVDAVVRASGSISGCYSVGVEVAHSLDSRGVQHLGYGFNIGSEPSRIWGIDYQSALVGERRNYTEKGYSAWLRYAVKLGDFNVGAYADYRYIEALKFDDVAAQILQDERLRLSTASVAIFAEYDLRTEAGNDGVMRGVYAMIEGAYSPDALNNIDGNIVQLRAQFDYYQPLWHGAMAAFDIYGETTSANTPWLLQPQLGSDSRMRGYYAGRFRGDCLATAQVELRQHIWRGIGVVAWGGAGMVYNKGERFDWSRALPTYGAGLRYRYDRLAIRFDVAFGRCGHTFILGLNEAF